jgi:hypothetical protein
MSATTTLYNINWFVSAGNVVVLLKLSVTQFVQYLVELCYYNKYNTTKRTAMSTTIQSRHGRRYQMQEHAHLSRVWGEHRGPYQVRNLRRLRDLVPRARTIIDVGAHIGSNTIEYATWAETVHSFEPNPQTYQHLVHNIAWNAANQPQGRYWRRGQPGHWPDIPDGWYKKHGTFASLAMTAAISTYNLALSHRPGTATLRTRNQGLADYITHNPEHSGPEVQLVTVDSFGFENVDAIKLDTEGTEWWIIQGADQTIQKYRPVVQVEMWRWDRRHGINNQDMLDYFRSLDYRQTDVQGRPVAWDELGRISGLMDRFFVPC